MTLRKILARARALAVASAAAAALALSCRLGPDRATLDARTFRPVIGPVAGAGDPAPMRATYFPPTAPRPGRRSVPLVVVEPLLFRRELLYDGPAPSNGLVPYLQGEGFPVWLVWIDAVAPPAARALSRGIAETVAAIAKETGARRFDLMGLSLGAEAVLRALEPLTAAGSAVEIRRVVFLGGGFDFAYPRSFASRIATIRNGPASALCALDGDLGCAREFRAASIATPWLASLPAADDDALAPAQARFPFVAHLIHLPVLFVAGKIDGIAPSESIFPLYTLWGRDEPDPRAVPKVFFLAGRENGLGSDFDQLDLLAGNRAEALWGHVADWLRLEE